MRCVEKTTGMHSTTGYVYIFHDHGTNCVMKVHINGRQDAWAFCGLECFGAFLQAMCFA